MTGMLQERAAARQAQRFAQQYANEQHNRRKAGMPVTEGNSVRGEVSLKNLAKNALEPIAKKLKGIRSPIDNTSGQTIEKEISTSDQVEALINEATSAANLAKMYQGWAAWL